MLTIDDLNSAIHQVLDGRIHLEDFERWMRRESRDVHVWGSAGIVQAVLAIEAVLSEYHFADMDEAVASAEIVAAIRPFVPSLSVRMVSFGQPSGAHSRLKLIPTQTSSRSATAPSQLCREFSLPALDSLKNSLPFSEESVCRWSRGVNC